MPGQKSWQQPVQQESRSQEAYNDGRGREPCRSIVRRRHTAVIAVTSVVRLHKAEVKILEILIFDIGRIMCRRSIAKEYCLKKYKIIGFGKIGTCFNYSMDCYNCL